MKQRHYLAGWSVRCASGICLGFSGAPGISGGRYSMSIQAMNVVVKSSWARVHSSKVRPTSCAQLALGWRGPEKEAGM